MKKEMSKEELSLEKYWQMLVGKRGFRVARAGVRIKNGVVTDESCITVAVGKKLPLCELTDEERIPDAFPDGTPIDIVETQKITASGDGIVTY